jgi:hypothetical protein
MRSLRHAAGLLLLASPLPLGAADVKLGTCESSTGVWEFANPAGGRGLVARDGPKYQVIWITKAANATTGASDAVGGAGHCTCAAETGKLVWKCHIAYSLQPNEMGADQTYEWAVDGDALRSFLIGQDGKRNEGVAIRRPK